MNQSDNSKAFGDSLAFLPNELSRLILNKISYLATYEPIIGIMGKTGVGKSSLCNALFQGKVSPVSDVSACTRDALRFRFQSGSRYLTLIDLPGVGESQQRDREYESLYRHVLPDIDLIMWVIKADDRALAVDEHFYRYVLGDVFQSKVLFVVNQADKIEPCHEWNSTSNQPSPLQIANLDLKVQDIKRLFKPINRVCKISVKTNWNLTEMVEAMVESLPEKTSSPVSAQLHSHLKTERVKETARNDFGSAVGGVLDVVASLPVVPRSVKSLIHQVRDAIVSIARSVWDFFF
ncbi:GTPase family protein [Pantoea eucrina]|uniref:GTPase family protein n=1 Tax=Pantoea eucrina TaxID=472693 RepID=UPI00301B73A7